MKKILILVVLLVAIISLGFFIKGGFGGGLVGQEVSMEDPVDIVLNFTDEWTSALNSSTTDPYKLDLDKTPILSKDLRKKLSDAKGHSDEEVDPVLCQLVIPDGVSARVVFENEMETEILILPTDTGLSKQAIFKLNHLNDGWYINDITCSLGEFAPDREFSFDNEGFLFKDQLSAVGDKWQILFEEDGEVGHTAPLIFNSESVCRDMKGEESTCSPDQFSETSKALVRGEMSESGVEVKRLEFTEEPLKQ